MCGRLRDRYFLPGADGWHAQWGTRMFDFGKTEVLRFLLAQLCWCVRHHHKDSACSDCLLAVPLARAALLVRAPQQPSRLSSPAQRQP